MEMPVDILNKELGAIRDNGDIDFDNTMAAVNIDTILQEKFLFIPLEEIDAIEIEHTNLFSAGSGPENCQAGESENPQWLYNHAMNALALYRHLTELERLAEEKRRIERNRRVIISRRPEPGVYMLNTGGEVHLTVVTAERNIIFGRSRMHETLDVTDIFDGLENKAAWTFTPIETGLSA